MKNSFVIFAFLTVFSSLFSQFTTINQNITNSFEFAEINETAGVALIGGVRVSKSIDAGFTWNEINLGYFAMPWTIYSFADAAIISSNTYCLIGNDNINNKGIIIKTTDGGLTWTNVFESSNQSGVLFGEIHNNGNTVIASTTGGVYVSNNAGTTWTFKAFGVNLLNTKITYNPTTNKWICAHYSATFESSDNGDSWNQFSLFVNGLNEFLGINESNFVVNKNTSNLDSISGELYLINGNFQVVDTIHLWSDFTNATQIEDVFFLPTGKIIAASKYYFFLIDPLTNNFYYYEHHLFADGDYVETTDFKFGATYGLAVGAIGAVSRFNLAQSSNVYLPADFSLSGASCPSDTLIGNPVFTHADSVQWYYNAQLVSTDVKLEFPTPYIFGNQEIIFHNWYKGHVEIDTQTIYFPPLNSAPNFNTTLIDQTPCFNNTVYLNGDIVSGAGSNTSLDIWLDNQLLRHTSPVLHGNMTLTTPIIASEDTLYIVTSKVQTCGTSYDSTIYILHPGNDLRNNFTHVNVSDTFCNLTAPLFLFDNTHSNCTYQLSLSNSSYSWAGDEFAGDENSQIELYGNVLYNFYTASPYQSNVFELTIRDDNNCEQSLFLDTTVIVNPDAMYLLHSQSFYLGDTVKLSNATRVNNRTWSVEPNNLTISGIHDTVPVIISNSPGIYKVKLVNNPLPGCKDSLVETIRFGEVLPELNYQSCWQVESPERSRILHVKHDHAGNIFELAVKNGDPESGWAPPICNIIKRNPEGQQLWEIGAPGYSGLHLKGAVIEDFDFDDEGNLYCALWIQADFNYIFDLINYHSISYQNKTRQYIIKINGETGEMTWVRDLTADLLPFSAENNAGRWRLSDLIVANNKIHVAVQNSGRSAIYTFGMNGVYLTHDFFRTATNSPSAFPNSFLIGDGSAGSPTESYRAIQLKEMSDGEILVICHYGNGIFHDIPMPELDSDHAAILLAKYNSDLGFYGFKRVAQIPNFTGTKYYYDNAPVFEIDKNDNITIAGSWGMDWPHITDPIVICDSSFSFNMGTCIFQVNRDFELNWITTTKYTNYLSLDVAQETGEIYLAGLVHDNITFSHNESHLTMGIYGAYFPEYDEHFEYWDLHAIKSAYSDNFIVKFDSSGNVLSGSYFDASHSYANNNYGSPFKISVSPCGDLIAALDHAENDTLTLMNGQEVFTIASGKTFKFSTNCSATNNCHYATVLQDSLNYCLGNDAIYVSFSESFNPGLVSYEIIENGNIISVGTKESEGSGFYLDTQSSSGEFILNLTSPLEDSIFISPIAAHVPTYSFDSIICVNELTVIVGSIGYSYSWNNLGFIDNRVFNFSSPNEGYQNVFVKSKDANYCISYDTLTLFVNSFVDENAPYFSFDSLVCISDSNLIAAAPANYSYLWNGQVSANGNEFMYEANSGGTNNVIITSFDPNNCKSIDTVQFQAVGPIVPQPNILYYEIACSDPALIISYSTENYINSTFWLESDLTENYFDSTNLSQGINSVTMVLLDTNQCVFSADIEINFCDNLSHEEISDKEVGIFPNPNNGNFFLFLNENHEQSTLEVFDLNGRMVGSYETNSETNEINSNLAKGTYLMKINARSGYRIFKIVIE
jgi:hypothetical protein